MVTDRINLKIQLTDFTKSTNYVDKYNDHLGIYDAPNFDGNLLLASLGQLSNIRPSRRSDLQSLCYIIIFILNGFEMPLYQQQSFNQQFQVFNTLTQMKKFKEQNTISILLNNVHSRPIYHNLLLSFLEMISSLDYEEKPNYKKL